MSADDEEVQRFERTLPHPPEKVWRALTDAGELGQWLPGAAANDGEGPPSLPVRPEGRPAGVARVIECEPPRVLSFVTDDEAVRWELSPVPGGCHLVLTTRWIGQRSGGANDVTACAA